MRLFYTVAAALEGGVCSLLREAPMKSLIGNCALLTVALLLGGVAHADTAAAGLDSAEGRLAAYRRMQCSMTDGKESFFWWTGTAYGHVPGQPDLRLFRVEGINVRRCASVPHAERGDGFRLISREILVYQDIETGEMLRNWENPYTGETVEVIHVANDPVNQPPQHPLRRDGSEYPLPLVTQGNDWWWSAAVPLFYPNPLGGEYQDYVGGTYHSTEIFDFNGDTRALLDADAPVAWPVVSWVRLAPWLPWMEMGSRAGMMYFNAMGRKLESFEQLSATMRAEIAASYPEYVAPPPVDDNRPNETSWTYMKKIIDGAGP